MTAHTESTYSNPPVSDGQENRHGGQAAETTAVACTGFFLVTEPGMTPLHPGQMLSEEDLHEAEVQLEPSYFAVRPLDDFIDDWLTTPAAGTQTEGPLPRRIIRDALFGEETADSEIRSRSDDGNLANLYRRAAMHISRLDRMRISGAPEIVRCNERRLLGATVRDLIAAGARQAPHGDGRGADHV